MKATFLTVVNSLITDREGLLMELRMVRDTLTGTEKLEKEQKRLAKQMNMDADVVQEIITENSRVAQDLE